MYLKTFLSEQYDHSHEIRFSSPSGFYEDAFSLAIEGGDEFEIRYTLDGSAPTMNSAAYRPESPIEITDASEKENVFSNRTDISAGYSRYVSDPPGFAAPEQKVDKCTVVRASVFTKGGDLLQSIHGVYFVGFQDKPAYEDAFIVSLCAQPEDLFGYDTGIFVTGKTFDNFLRISTNSDGAFESSTKAYWWWPANYRKEGGKWERQAQVTVFDEQREIALDLQCGIRIHGGGSRGFPSKSIRCIARTEYADSDVFPVRWFGETVQPHKFVLYSGGDDYDYKLKDYLGQTLAESLHFATQDCIPCCLFINGEYWGFYFITENFNKNYISDHYGVTDSNVIMVKAGEVAEGTNRDYRLYTQMQNTITSLDMSVAENYRKACELIDMESYIDYYAFQIYIGRNNDWPANNYAAWRTREPEEGTYGDCRWRWMLFDLNSGGISEKTLNEDTLARVLRLDSVFISLWESEEFRSRFAERIHLIGSELLSADACTEFIDTYDAAFGDQLTLNSKRFYNTEKEAEQEAYMEQMRNFFAGRYAVVKDFLAAHME